MCELQQVYKEKIKKGVETTPDLEKTIDVLSQLFGRRDPDEKPPMQTQKK